MGNRLRAPSLVLALAALLCPSYVRAATDLSDVTWSELRARAQALADRPGTLIEAGDASRLPTPQMRGEGGARTFLVHLFNGDTIVSDQIGEKQYYFQWRGIHGYSDAAGQQGLRTYTALLNNGENQLRQHGLPIDSVGSALAFALLTYYELAVGPQNPAVLDRRETRGYIVLLMALIGADGSLASADQREAVYQQVLVEAEQMREAAKADPAHADAYRDAAAEQLRAVRIDARGVRIDRVICSISGTQSCEAVYADAAPVLDKLAAAFPF